MTAREEAAVNEWLESNASLHSMRDHPAHYVPLVGGGWGARLTDREQWEIIWTEILEDSLTYSDRQKKGPDQYILTNHVWKVHFMSGSHIFQHDSYLCESYPGSIGFPTRRKKESYNFILALSPEPLWEECPVSCRRNKEWEFC